MTTMNNQYATRMLSMPMYGHNDELLPMIFAHCLAVGYYKLMLVKNAITIDQTKRRMIVDDKIPLL